MSYGGRVRSQQFGSVVVSEHRWQDFEEYRVRGETKARPKLIESTRTFCKCVVCGWEQIGVIGGVPEARRLAKAHSATHAQGESQKSDSECGEVKSA